MLQRDTNKNGTLEQDEFPEGPLKPRFPHFDRDKDGHVTKPEYEAYRNVIVSAVNRFVAIKPGGQGDITSSHVLWEQRKDIPFVPSPLYYNDHIFLIKNPGILVTLDAKTGKQVKAERVSSGSDYYASPAAADGKVFLLSQRGHLTVVSGEGQWKVLHRARFDEDGFATPVIFDGRLYLRTTGHLYCFGE
jgi:outer membrane protein assembly factor BamB